MSKHLRSTGLAPYRKAVMGTLGAGAAALGTAMLDGDLTQAEAIAAAGMALVTGFATWRVRNVDA